MSGYLPVLYACSPASLVGVVCFMVRCFFYGGIFALCTVVRFLLFLVWFSYFRFVWGGAVLLLPLCTLFDRSFFS